MANQSPWRVWHFKEALGHVVYGKRLHALLDAEMIERGHPMEDPYPDTYPNGRTVSEICLDCGGSCIAGSPYEEISMYGLKVSVPSDHVGLVIMKANKCEPRFFGNVEYRKLKVWFKAYVMLPKQLDLLVKKLKAIEVDAHRRADAFGDAWLAKMQAKNATP